MCVVWPVIQRGTRHLLCGIMACDRNILQRGSEQLKVGVPPLESRVKMRPAHNGLPWFKMATGGAPSENGQTRCVTRTAQYSLQSENNTLL